jgi:hypothetical protein
LEEAAQLVKEQARRRLLLATEKDIADIQKARKTKEWE